MLYIRTEKKPSCVHLSTEAATVHFEAVVDSSLTPSVALL